MPERVVLSGEVRTRWEADKAKADGESGRSVDAAISIKAWDPKTPYMAALKKAGIGEALPVYLEQRKSFGTSPAFFLDCADYFFANKQPELGLQVLSNLAELELENAALLRVLAHRLAQLQMLDLAALTFEEVLGMRPEEPQSWRDLGLVLAAEKRYARAMELLAHVVMNKWDRFDEIEVISLMELNTIIPKAKAAGISSLPVDPRLVKLLDVDVRIILTWDADLTDIDLHLVEPSGETAFYGHNRTAIGGLVSRDFTQGYGPEEYLVRKAMKGTYQVKTNFFGSQAQRLTGAVTLQVEIFTNYGRPDEKRQTITVRLTEKKETIDIGEVKL
jgi:tetratricopeptide (TPR) repeat protein